MTIQEKRRQLFETLYPLPSGLAFGATGSYVVTSVPALKFAELSRFEYNKLWGCFNTTLDALVIELPPTTWPDPVGGPEDYLADATRLHAVRQCYIAIESTGLGIKVK